MISILKNSLFNQILLIFLNFTKMIKNVKNYQNSVEKIQKFWFFSKLYNLSHRYTLPNQKNTKYKNIANKALLFFISLSQIKSP